MDDFSRFDVGIRRLRSSVRVHQFLSSCFVAYDLNCDAALVGVVECPAGNRRLQRNCAENNRSDRIVSVLVHRSDEQEKHATKDDAQFQKYLEGNDDRRRN
ncbi:hypothetical protein M9Y10_016169 [Tritrichomonas musculus]|uniref:Uncharacterized protein n=1 Tax=Tritrichomonas musculus TaxID=1915356 RepID=A0ABR2I5H8_9EUKA